MLLKEPGLGRAVEPKFLVDRTRLKIGQRFYYWRFPGPACGFVSGPGGRRRSARVSQTNVTFDFPKGELRIFLLYSEAKRRRWVRCCAGARLPVRYCPLSGWSPHAAWDELWFPGCRPGRCASFIEAVPTEQFRSPLIGAGLS